MICERRPFKRLLVLSERGNPELWEKLTKLRKNYGWQERVEFQNKVQKDLIGIIDSIDNGKRTSTILSKDITDKIVGRATQGEVLFLVDIPGEREGSSWDLYFLPESRIYGSLTPLTSTGSSLQMEDSIIWTGLSTNFLQSIGKIRVFCHPDIIDTCAACLNRLDIESTLKSAYQYVTR